MPPVKVVKVLSGFCGIGCHEGTRPRSFTGKPMKVCTMYETCSCDCHAKLTKMYTLTDTPRVPVDNPEYIPHVSSIWNYIQEYRDTAELLPSSIKEVPKEVPVEEYPALATSGIDYQPTDKGSRAPGQLEDEIRQVCNRFLMREFDVDYCTPKFVQSQISPEPSIGAIGQAFRSWDKIGFAIVKISPVRFVSFTADGMRHGLAEMKARSKQGTRRASSNR